jgi:hypothetical protein
MTLNFSERFEAALKRFDLENSKDPNSDTVDGATHPRELLYAKRLSDWVRKLSPEASEELLLAARCQHICRWTIPRNTYPMTRAGYLQWRSDLKKFHAQKAGEILTEVGYPSETISRVQDLNLKKNFPQDPETQTLEDALCLVFLEFQFAEFAQRTEEAKVIGVLQKTWKKMSAQGRDRALKLNIQGKAQELLKQALNS